MKYAIVECTNGNFNVKAEYSDPEKAKVGFHDRCKGLWNDKPTLTAMVMIVDENLDPIEGGKYKEYIHHDTEAEAPAAE